METDRNVWLIQHGKQSRLISNGDVPIEYLAGFFDGEGCFSTTIVEEGRVPSFVMSVGTTNQSEPAMFEDRFGGSVSRRVPENENHSTWWNWTVSGHTAKLAAEALLPHLVGKKEQCEMFVKALRYRSRSCTGYSQYDPKSKERLREYSKQIRSMNSAQRRYAVGGD